MTDQSTPSVSEAVPSRAITQKRGLKSSLAQYGIYVALLILVVFFTISSDVFLTSANLLNVLRQVSIIGICAVGLTFVLLTGGIDLSVGSVIGVAGMTCATQLAFRSRLEWRRRLDSGFSPGFWPDSSSTRRASRP
jgi:ribose/xylose/arabinose/galactoside ABC-type transport system permease subunit